MAKNPLIVENIEVKNGGAITTEAGTEIVSVSSAGVPSLKANIQDSLAQGSIYIGNSSGVTSELDIKTSGRILVGNGTTATSVAVSGDATLASNGALTIANDAVTEAKTVDSAGLAGLYVKKTALCVYDFAVDGGTAGTITLGGKVTIPDNAVVTATTYDVLTTCQSASDAATIKLALATDGDLTTAIAISNGANPWDAGAHAPNTPLYVKTTGARDTVIVVAGGENLTAGKIVFAIDYYISQ